MSSHRILPLTLIFLLLAARSYAQKGSWDAVEKLSPGTPISVLPERGHRFRCDFREATDDHLACEVVRHLAPCLVCQLAPRLSREDLTQSVVFDRRAVRQVHQEHPSANAALGVAIGGGIGVGLGSLGGDKVYRPVGQVFFGGLLAVIGAAIGKGAPIIRGTAIFER